jgi:hypothetical protein
MNVDWHRFRNQLLANSITAVFMLPFCSLGIVATGIVLMHALGIGPQEQSWSFVLLFLVLVPLGIFGFGGIGYMLLLIVLRLLNAEAWYARQLPPHQPTWLDTPLRWAGAAVDHLIPRRRY